MVAAACWLFIGFETKKPSPTPAPAAARKWCNPHDHDNVVQAISVEVPDVCDRLNSPPSDHIRGTHLPWLRATSFEPVGDDRHG